MPTIVDAVAYAPGGLGKDWTLGKVLYSLTSIYHGYVMISKSMISTGPELMKLKDRHGHDYVIGPTHEEAFTAVVAENINSYRDLPARLYQVIHGV